MHFVFVLAILVALVISENCPPEPVSGAGYRLLAAASGMMLVAAFALVGSGLIARGLRRDLGRRTVLLRLLRTLRRAHAVLWLGVAAGILYWLDWAQLVRFNWRLDHTFLVDDLLILVPVLVPMVLSWAAFYEADRAAHAGLAGPGSAELALPSRRAYVGLHLRHYLGILLLPVLGLLAVQDAAELLVPGILQHGGGIGVYAPSMILLFALFPSLLRRVWKTSPLAPGPLRTRLEAAARRAGFRARDILVWHTGRMVVNAAVAGFTARLRYVFLTDGLLARLTDEEVEAVFGHEMGHIRHHHLVLRVLAATAPLSLVLLVQQAFPEAARWIEDWLAGGGWGFSMPAGLLTVGALAVYMLLVFGGYSRLQEAEADLFGCRTLASGGHGQPVDVFTSALENLAAGSGVGRRARAWLHGSIARRVDFATRIAHDAKGERRFRWQMRFLDALVVWIVLGLPVCCLLLS